MNKYIAKSLSLSNINELIVPKMVHLVKRTEENVPILYFTLDFFDKEDIDMSFFGKEIILEVLPDYFFTEKNNGNLENFIKAGICIC
jgi:hypothetical protein